MCVEETVKGPAVRAQASVPKGLSGIGGVTDGPENHSPDLSPGSSCENRHSLRATKGLQTIYRS